MTATNAQRRPTGQQGVAVKSKRYRQSSENTGRLHDVWAREVCECCLPSYIEPPSAAEIAHREAVLQRDAIAEMLRRGRISPSDRWIEDAILLLLEDALAISEQLVRGAA